MKLDQLSPERTRVHLEMGYEPDGVIDNVGDVLEVGVKRVEGDLERFEEFIEARQMERGSGARRSTIPNAPGGRTRGA